MLIILWCEIIQLCNMKKYISDLVGICTGACTREYVNAFMCVASFFCLG